MRKAFILMTAAAFAASCMQPQRGADGNADGDDTIAVTLPTHDSDVYDQGRTEACWIYAMCACIEHETCLRGDSLVLSRQWLMSHLMEEQAAERYEIISNGRSMPAEGGRGTLTMCGVGPEAIRLIGRYGLVPYQHERSRISNSNVLQRKLALMAENAAAQRLSPQQFRNRIQPQLPRFTVARHTETAHECADSTDESFYYLSMRYTPQQFAESVMYYQKWNWYASDEGHPWGAAFALEVPDNRRYHEYTNKPMSELLRMVKESLRRGHAVYWELGCEPSRQKHGGGAASDHAMAIVGTKGGRFVCLNSYGTGWGHKGYCLVTEAYFIAHTCNVGIIEVSQ